MAPAQRTAFLAELAADDAALAAEVRGLLAADAEAEDFLEGGAHPAWAGRRFGPWRVVGEVARGGMGIVLLGERADGRYDARVAIKVLNTAYRDGLAARFRTEGRILAELDHPNIARLYDAGETHDGLSYLVMEYVDGDRLDVWADAQRLDVRGRLELFRTVLEGVAAAHARGVVHRDLKPSNILVTTAGVPKLVDFGIAKLLHASPAADATIALTRTALRVMTPEYASPEQIRGLPVDASSDVYSLGVVLYRLLTGHPPYALADTEPGVAERIVCEQSPRRPSDVVTRPLSVASEGRAPEESAERAAELRSSTRDRLQRTLRGDLDTIVLTALGKEPGERYASAAAFAEDIGRYLEGRAILARAPSLTYRASRVLRRRWKAVVTAGVLLMTTGGALWQARLAAEQRAQAESNRAELERLVGDVLSGLSPYAQEAPSGATAARAAAVTTALRSLDQLARGLGSEPDAALLGTLAGAYFNVGLVEGHPSNPNLGNARGARESFRTAEGLWERVVRAQPRDPDARFGHAQARMALGDSYLFGARNDSAALYYGQAAATLDSLHAEAPDDAVVAGQLSNAAYRLAAIADSEGRLDDMVGWMQRGLAIDERNAEGLEPGAQADQRLANLVNSRRNVGYALGKVGRLEEALAVQRAAVRLADSLVDLPTAGPVTRSLRAYQYEQLGWRLLELDRLEEADIALSRAVDLAEANRREDPSNASATVAVGTAYEGRGQARIKADRWEEALSDHRRALALLEPQAEAWPSLGFIVSQIHREIGESLGALGRFEEAEAAHRSAFAGAEALLALDTAHVPARKVLAVSHFAYARLQRQRARAGVEPAAACAAARVAEDRARALWTALADAGQVFPGEALIWEDFEQRMPEGVCP